MKIVAYADESGTHDRTGSKSGASEAVVGGLVAWREDWDRFYKDWRHVLEKYDAPYFHFAEFAVASAILRKKRSPFSGFEKNPYRRWSLPNLDSFLNELASLVGSGNKIVVGGYVNTSKFSKAKAVGDKNVPHHGDPYKYCVAQFFDSFRTDVLLRWPLWTESVQFVFDQTDDPVWKSAILEVFNEFQRHDQRYGSVSFADKKEALPLQAADMIAYRMRQITGKYVKREMPQAPGMPELDKHLFKEPFNFFCKHPDFALGEFLGAMNE